MSAEVVFAGSLSHSPLMFVPGIDGGAEGKRYKTAVETLRAELAAAEADTAVIFFPDHFRAVRYDLMPAFCVGLRELATWGDWYLPELTLRVDTSLASHILAGLLGDGFDPAFSVDLRIDHGGAQPVHVLGLEGTAIVPILINCAAPPLPSLQRSIALGKSVGAALASFPEARRVAVIGSGGLSHHVPLPLWQELDPERSEQWDAFVAGIPDAQRTEVERRRVARMMATLGTSETRIDPVLDKDVLDMLERGALDELADLDPTDLVARGGSGMNEIRAWIAAAGATAARGAEVVDYVAVWPWATGMGVIKSRVL
ncbi:MAG: hypothetical protein M0Z40_19110 [Actinomycetota bacterium]|jgi:2,3-dihydroxyphenylpropionate 1,2-dioxygenase|nr:hypothetical protein [Actinomycetota bacterium]MDA8077290.1 hypothetical protein [Actinomycetota bacterium]